MDESHLSSDNTRWFQLLRSGKINSTWSTTWTACSLPTNTDQTIRFTRYDSLQCTVNVFTVHPYEKKLYLSNVINIQEIIYLIIVNHFYLIIDYYYYRFNCRMLLIYKRTMKKKEKKKIIDFF